MAWGKNGTPSTLTGVADTITISDLTAKKFNIILDNHFASGNIETKGRIGSSSIDSTSGNYATTQNNNGTVNGDYTSITNRTALEYENGSSYPNNFSVWYGINIATEEKLFIINWVGSNTVGAGYAPVRVETVSKWINTSNQFNQIQTLNIQGGDLDTGSNLSVIGTD